MKNVMLCLVCSLSVAASALEYSLITRESKSGAPLVAIDNNGSTEIYCTIGNEQYFVDFYVSPHSQSRWYYEPKGEYEWGCQ